MSQSLAEFDWPQMQSGKTSHECPGYNIKQSYYSLALELWGMWNTSSLPSLPG